MAARQYFTHTPILIQQLNLLNAQTPFTLALTLGEFIFGGIIPLLIYTSPKANQRWGNLVIAAAPNPGLANRAAAELPYYDYGVSD